MIILCSRMKTYQKTLISFDDSISCKFYSKKTLVKSKIHESVQESNQLLSVREHGLWPWGLTERSLCVSSGNITQIARQENEFKHFEFILGIQMTVNNLQLA